MNKIEYSFEHYPELESTSDLVRERAAEGEPEGLVVIADYQTKGHGQHGRKWESPPRKGLLFSILLRPKIAPNKSALLTRTVCNSVAKVLEDAYGISTSFKQPNDLMVGKKKICGVLVEAISETSDLLESAVVGIGLNVNTAKDDLLDEATSMRVVQEGRFERKEVLGHLLGQIQADLAEYYASNQ